MSEFEREIQRFFFRAMLDGSASGNRLGEVIGMPGYKQFRCQEGDFCLSDLWCTTSGSERSAGITTIWYLPLWNPVWVMQYNGECPKEAIPFLKKVFRRAYTSGKFLGGRGETVVGLEDGFTYMNWVKQEGFVEFYGREEIFDSTGRIVGHHNYIGGKL